MTTTITGGPTLIVPIILTDLSETREGGSLVHRVLGRVDPDVTLRPAGLRSGRIELGFAGADAESASQSAVASLSTASVFTLVDTERATFDMRFIVPEGGRIERPIESETRAAFVVAFDYQEVGS